MLVDKAVAPPYDVLRPVKSSHSEAFPVYDDLVQRLLAAHEHPDPTAAHLLAVASGYAYSDAATMAMIMARMGLESNHCLRLTQSVDSMFIASHAYLVQSQDGSVVVLAYRGTEPTRVVGWLTDLDVHPDGIAFPFDDTGETYKVHAGFYRNVRATRYEVASALLRALKGRSVLAGKGTSPSGLPDRGVMPGPMRALYVTGHSLGGAMAALMTVMLTVEPDYAKRFGDVLRAGYTYGQPMVGSPEFAELCQGHPFLGSNVVRYVYRQDVVPHLPPRDSDRFGHFGKELRYRGDYPWSDTSADPVRQMGHLLGLVEVPLDFVADRFAALRGLRFRYSVDDHLAHRYVTALTPPGVPNEFGDDYVIVDD